MFTKEIFIGAAITAVVTLALFKGYEHFVEKK